MCRWHIEKWETALSKDSLMGGEIAFWLRAWSVASRQVSSFAPNSDSKTATSFPRLREALHIPDIGPDLQFGLMGLGGGWLTRCGRLRPEEDGRPAPGGAVA